MQDLVNLRVLSHEMVIVAKIRGGSEGPDVPVRVEKDHQDRIEVLDNVLEEFVGKALNGHMKAKINLQGNVG